MPRGTPLAGSRVLVTGGGSGLGRRMALGAAARGAHVVVWDLSAARAEAVRDEIRERDLPADAVDVDVADRTAVEAAARETGQVDVVVSNAGVVSGKRLLETSPEAIERTFAVNTLALYWVTRAFLPAMVERRRGTVVTIASAAGLVGVSRQTDYSASKFAAVGFTESLRGELRSGRTGVATLLVCPYYIDTGMFDGVVTRVPWLLPILQETDVARRVLHGIERGREQIVLPPVVRLLPAARLLPVPAFDRVLDLLGINRSMDRFTGRPDYVVP